MSIELEYEHNNKEVLEKCCLVMEFKTDEKKITTKARRGTRLSIDAILEQRALRETIELHC